MTRRPKLHLIRGGKVRRGKSPPGKKKKGRRPHPLNDLLWYATSHAYYPARATGYDIISERMTRLSKRILGREMKVSPTMASQTIYDCRRRHIFYGWTILHAERGGLGFNRGYVPVQCDVDGEDYEIFLIDDADLLFAIAGLKSSIRGIEATVKNDADGLGWLIGCLEALEKDRAAERFRDFVVECRTFARRAEEIRKYADGL